MTGSKDLIIQTDSDADLLALIKSSLQSTGPNLILVDSWATITTLAQSLSHLYKNIIQCTPETTQETLRSITARTPVILITIAPQLADRLSKKQIKRSYFKCIIISELEEILARGCRDQVQELLKTPLEDTRIIITTSSPLPNDLLSSFKKILNNPDIRQSKPVVAQEQSLSLVSGFFINYKHNGWKFAKLMDFIKTMADAPMVIICNSRRTVENLAEELQQVGIQANTIHADLDLIDRNDSVTIFLAGMTRYLIATELAYLSVAKDIKNSVIINYDMPLHKEKYLMRVGDPRISGKVVISFIVDDDSRLIREVEKQYDCSIVEMLGSVVV